MSLELKTEFFMAIEDYEPTGSEKRNNGIDIKALDNDSKDKVLLRIINKPKSKTGYVGANTVDKMADFIKNEDFDKGVLISNRFTKAAKRKLEEEGIRKLSDGFMAKYSPDRLYLASVELVNAICKAKCGKIPSKESDCKGHNNGNYSCKIRLISDNASFHFQRSWLNLLQKDILQLLSANHAASN
jgi:hypothetical protein